jgi:hypothetical protein
MTKSLAKVHLNNEEVITLVMRKSYKKIVKGGKEMFVTHSKKATVNGRRIPWETANLVFAECLKAGTIPEMDCGK